MGGEFNKSESNDITLHEFTSDFITTEQLEEWYSKNEQKFEFPTYKETLENRFEYWKKQFPEIMKELSSLLRASSSFGYNSLLHHYVVMQNFQQPIGSREIPKKLIHFQEFLNDYLFQNGFTASVKAVLIVHRDWNSLRINRLKCSIEPIFSTIPERYSEHTPVSKVAILTIGVGARPRVRKNE